VVGADRNGESGGASAAILASPAREEESYLGAIAKAINALTFVDTYQQRQLWVELCHRLLEELPRHIFERYFVEGLVRLTSDAVLNVRVTVAMLLAGWAPKYPAPWEEVDPTTDIPVSPWRYLLRRKDIQECVERLSKDDHDVYFWVKRLQPLFPSIEFQSVSCRGRKEAPGGATPVLSGNMASSDSDTTRFEEDGIPLPRQLSRSSATSPVFRDLVEDQVIGEVGDMEDAFVGAQMRPAYLGEAEESCDQKLYPNWSSPSDMSQSQADSVILSGAGQVVAIENVRLIAATDEIELEGRELEPAVYGAGSHFSESDKEIESVTMANVMEGNSAAQEHSPADVIALSKESCHAQEEREPSGA